MLKFDCMELTIKVPDELAAQAEARGLRAEEYAEQILAREAAAHASEVRPPRTPEEIEAWLDSLAQFSDKIPELPEVITREWIYGDHP